MSTVSAWIARILLERAEMPCKVVVLDKGNRPATGIGCSGRWHPEERMTEIKGAMEQLCMWEVPVSVTEDSGCACMM